MDRRQSFRHSVDESVQVRSIDAPGTVTVGRIDDISDDGLRLTLNGYFPPGSVIEVECRDWKLCGTVIYECKSEKHSDAEYSCGIRTVHLAWNGTQTQYSV
jgi:hypothetical protein